MQTQLPIDFTRPHAPPFPAGWSSGSASECAASAIRAVMTFEEMRVERQSITDIGMRRYEEGDRTGLGGPRGHQDCGTPFSVFDWLTDAELERFHQLGLALPTRGEEQLAARARIQARITARKAAHRQVS
ncbi:hypothetical protein [Pseudomonas baetica]|uniref:hypothetical protein n=1 Tax=Pseudomonas baetica TaxID=674054 RepID=UPI0024051205|nr:hypothetical protein [Pseudomonas baetica]MDF9779050.1 hypothetical protein [Pseudomonas baetica]